MEEGWGAVDAEACRALFFHSPDGVLFTDPDGRRILAANPAVCQLLLHSEADLQRLGRDGIVDPRDRSRWDAALAERGRTGVFEGELSMVRSDATTVTAEVTFRVFDDASGATRNCLIVRDVTEQRAAERSLRHSEQRFRRLIETSSEAFIAMDVEGRITDWNRQAAKTFGWSREEVVGRRLADTVIPPSYREAHRAGLARFLATGEGMVLGQRLELEGRRRDGSEFPVELTIWALGEGGGEIQFNAMLRDISERRRREEELWELALVDDLTGLHNRRSFLLLAEQAHKAAARAKRPAFALYVDVDHLKAINDTYGHAEGDRALRIVADALKGACRESDIVGRLSGDEFAVFLTEAHQTEGIEARVRRRVAESATAVSYPLTVSVGMASGEPTHDFHLSDLLARADQIITRRRR